MDGLSDVSAYWLARRGGTYEAKLASGAHGVSPLAHGRRPQAARSGPAAQNTDCDAETSEATNLPSA
jgi:hypothetical protein